MADEDNAAAVERSGRYPGVSLGDALEAVDKLYKAERQSPVNNATAATKMGYKSLSGPARVMIGALRQYGLIERTAMGQFRLTKLAIAALHGNAEQKADALKTAAMHPPLFRELSRTHLEGSEENLRSHLITSKGFIDTGARVAAKAFRDTLALAKITSSGYSLQSNGGEPEDNEPANGLVVGDYVQWESQGVVQFEARKVTGVTPDRTHLYVEGSMTGIPMDQVTKVDPPSSTTLHPVIVSGVGTAAGSSTVKGQSALIAREVSSLQEGEALLQWPASISAESVEELEDWLALVIKKMKRRYAPTKGNE